MKRSLLCLFPCVSGLLAITLTVFVVHGRRRDWVAPVVPDGTSVVVCGDSQTREGLDPALFPGFFNFSMVATTCDQDLLRLEDLLSVNKGRIKYVLLDVSPLKMNSRLLDVLVESVALVRSRGAYPIVTTMPQGEPFRKSFAPAKKKAFSAAVRGTVVRLSVPYLDYLDLDLPPEYWHDGNLLNRAGAAFFTPKFVADFRKTVKTMVGPLPDEKYRLTKIGIYKGNGVPVGGDRGRGLSGLTYAGGKTFWTIEEKSGALIELKIEIDAETGAITDVRDVHRTTVPGENFEGVAFDPLSPRLWVCEETGNTIQGFDLEKGGISDVVEVPVMRSATSNRGLEALGISSSGLDMWTCNENELPVDSQASPGSSEVVRLIHFTRATASAPWKMSDQWAYRPEQPISLDPRRQRKLRNGISSLCMMENGDLLILERETDKLRPDRCRARIYRVDREGATEVLGHASLASVDYVPVRKHLLYDGLTRHAQYEGLTLGPRLADGSRVAILVSDASDNGVECFMSLRLSTVGATR